MDQRKKKNNLYKRLFKDKCDFCGRFDFLKSINNKCLCQDCFNTLKKRANNGISKKINHSNDTICEIQLTIFDLEEKEKTMKKKEAQSYVIF